MKIELGEQRPENFKELWPGQFEVFHHFEYACGIPSILYAVTTMKENGRPNGCFCAWSSFGGDGDGFYAIKAMLRHTHTYQNIMRTGEYVVNFISQAHYDACLATIEHNGAETDEIAAGGFTAEDAVTLACPRLKEAFLCLECTLEKDVPLPQSTKTTLVIGRVRHIAMQRGYATGLDAKYGDDGFMLNIHSPRNLATGEGDTGGVAVCKVVRREKEI